MIATNVEKDADEGKSGLSIDGRDSFQRLLADIQGGNADFEAVLVYDVSRWGRFQDPNESAHYAWLCKSAGIALHFCAEQVENDGSMGSSIVTTVKQVMAGEYIVGMRERGYSDNEIAEKTGLSANYVWSVGKLLARGERRLVAAVEAGYLPISVALEICEADDQGVQAALHKAYEDKLLRGRALIAARRLVEVRKRSGKAAKLNRLVEKGSAATPEDLVKAFQEDTERKRMMIRKTEATRNRLVFIVEALSQLSNDESFIALLEDEDLASMPNRLAERIQNVRINLQ